VAWSFGGLLRDAKHAAAALSADAPQLDVLPTLPIAGRADLSFKVARRGAAWARNLFDNFDGAGSSAHMAVARSHDAMYTDRTNSMEGAVCTVIKNPVAIV
jgi:hypothetical protein